MDRNSISSVYPFNVNIHFLNKYCIYQQGDVLTFEKCRNSEFSNTSEMFYEKKGRHAL